VSALTLLQTLEGLGVTAKVTPAGNLRLEPASRVPVELLTDLRNHKMELVAILNQLPEQILVPLPKPLVRLVDLAVLERLDYPAVISTGMVPSLGTYVLAAAALYAAHRDPSQQLADLWMARKVCVH